VGDVIMGGTIRGLPLIDGPDVSMSVAIGPNKHPKIQLQSSKPNSKYEQRLIDYEIKLDPNYNVPILKINK